MQPVAFDRALFCLRNNARLTPVSCPDPPHLDALSHHPYGIGGPLWHALNADDVAVPDVYKLARVLHAAERARHVLPAGAKRLWVTELSWDTSPPDPNGVPAAKQARWLEQAGETAQLLVIAGNEDRECLLHHREHFFAVPAASNGIAEEGTHLRAHTNAIGVREACLKRCDVSVRAAHRRKLQRCRAVRCVFHVAGLGI